VPEGAGGAAGAGGNHVEVADGGAGLVHAGEGQRLGAQLVGQRNLGGIVPVLPELHPPSHLDIERDVFHGRHQQLHPLVYIDYLGHKI
jgi:hypothetical protein